MKLTYRIARGLFASAALIELLAWIAWRLFVIRSAAVDLKQTQSIGQRSAAGVH